MKIIVEAGATKSSWRIVKGDGEVLSYQFQGMNVSTMPMEHVLEVLSGALGSLGETKADGFYLYVAGIVTPQIREVLGHCIRGWIEVADLDIQNDLVAAARAVCGRSPGIAAILGTGSNLCFYDGDSVSQPVRSGGYIIGDEGGGAVLGKLFLADYIKGLVPEPIASEFAESHDATYEGIVNFVYKSPAPAGALGSLAPWLLERYDNPYVKNLIDRNFQSFIDRSLSHCDTNRYPVGVVGGWGYVCRDIFTRLCEAKGIKTGRFEPEPISGLMKNHGCAV
ncbi:MAG: hypothetical protein J6S97_02540 [Bacteroidales bacterium]|nr:hypothetical protein [Bacteroidales bacterium]